MIGHYQLSPDDADCQLLSFTRTFNEQLFPLPVSPLDRRTVPAVGRILNKKCDPTVARTREGTKGGEGGRRHQHAAVNGLLLV